VLSFVAHDHGWIRYVEQLGWLPVFLQQSKVSEPRTKQSLEMERLKTPCLTKTIRKNVHIMPVYLPLILRTSLPEQIPGWRCHASSFGGCCQHSMCHSHSAPPCLEEQFACLLRTISHMSRVFNYNAYHVCVFSLPVERFLFAHSLCHVSKRLQEEKRYAYHQLESGLLGLG
jgi:hypothetical protein